MGCPGRGPLGRELPGVVPGTGPRLPVGKGPRFPVGSGGRAGAAGRVPAAPGAAAAGRLPTGCAPVGCAPGRAGPGVPGRAAPAPAGVCPGACPGRSGVCGLGRDPVADGVAGRAAGTPERSGADDGAVALDGALPIGLGGAETPDGVPADGAIGVDVADDGAAPGAAAGATELAGAIGRGGATGARAAGATLGALAPPLTAGPEDAVPGATIPGATLGAVAGELAGRGAAGIVLGLAAGGAETAPGTPVG